MTPRAWNSTLPLKRERPRRVAPQTPAKGEGAAVLHPGPFRSQTLRDLAAKVPHCMNRDCRAANRGQIVAAHSNESAHGKGLSLKAHDVPAYLCGSCHDLLDGRAGHLSREEKSAMFLRAAYASMVWLLREGHLLVRAA